MEELSGINPRINMSSISPATCITTIGCFQLSPCTSTCHHFASLGGLSCQLVGDVYHLFLLLYCHVLFVLVIWAQSQARQHVLHAGGHM